MAKPKITSITIHPQKGGGHKVTHEYAAAAKYGGSAKNGGMSMESPPPAEHSFAPGEHNALMSHIAGALALKGLGTQAPGEGAGPGTGLGAGMPPGRGM